MHDQEIRDCTGLAKYDSPALAAKSWRDKKRRRIFYCKQCLAYHVDVPWNPRKSARWRKRK